MKFRADGVKHEHHNIYGIQPVLAELAEWIEIHVVIPGAFRPVKTSARTPQLSICRIDRSGVEIAVHVGNFIQDVHLLTNDAAALNKRLETRIRKQKADEKPRPKHSHRKQTSRNRSEDWYD